MHDLSLHYLIKNNTSISITYEMDVLHLRWFTEFLINDNKEYLKPDDFGDFEFLEFINWMSNKHSYKVIYTVVNTVRKLMRKFNSPENQFKTDPKYWPVPPKPEPNHFEVIDEEKRNILRKHLKVEIDKIYKKEELVQKALKIGKSITFKGVDFIEGHGELIKKVTNFYKWQESLEDVLYTIYKDYRDFPINMTVEESLPGHKYGRLGSINYHLMTSTYSTIYKRMGIQNLKSSQAFIEEYPNLSFANVITYLYPSFDETFCIRWAIELETAWSPDIVKNIDYKNYLYQPIPIEQKLAFIQSVKEKGQQSENIDFEVVKRMIWPSNTEDKYSAYNLIGLWIKRTSRLRSGFNYLKTVNSCGFEPFFIYLQDYQNIKNGINIITAIHPKAPNKLQSQPKLNYQRKHLGYTFDERQLKPTSLYLREKNQGMPLLLQVALFGHSDSAVTDENYKNTESFQQIRKDKLSIELNAIAESIQNDSFRGTLVPLRTQKRIKDKIITIFTDHINESPLSICQDNKKPDWPGSEKINLPCRMFNKCLLCSQSSVYEDNIPFVVDRFLYLQQLKKKMRRESFNSLYLDEFEATKEVVDYWPYKDQIQEAKDRTFDDGFLLPPIFWEIL